MEKINQPAVINNKQDACLSDDLIHQDLAATKNLVYSPSNFQCSQLIREAESIEYGAYTFHLNGYLIKFRVSKITPTKIGQFVTLWKRISNGPIQPYDMDDLVDFFVISTRKNNHFGQFVFPKAVLCKHDVISIKGAGGKRALRVYPPWEKSLNRQAQKTQSWQVEYFLDVPQDTPINCNRVRELYLLDLKWRVDAVPYLRVNKKLENMVKDDLPTV